MASLVFSNVSFSYPGSPARIFDSIQFGVAEGWTGVIGANGAGKTTLLQLAANGLSPSVGTIHCPHHVVYCPQRTDFPLDDFEQFLESTEGDAFRLRGQLGIEDDWLVRWDTLSHGERKRAQIASCLFQQPELLAVDEPTNHLDRDARDLVCNALHSFRGIGLLVSHDRDLLDSLSSHSLFVSPPNALLRGGGYSVAMKELEQEATLAREARTRAKSERKRLEREAVARREHLAKAEKKKSLRGIDPRDSDARQKAYAARNADSGVGKRMHHIEGRVRRAQVNEQAIDVVRQNPLGIGLQGARSSRNALFRRSASTLPLGDQRSLDVPDLLMQPEDRVALVGANGTGKSTLIRSLIQDLALSSQHVVYIPQEISVTDSSSVLSEAKGLRGARLGQVMQWVSRLGSDVEQLLASSVPSPGEVRKLMLALRMADAPHLVIMDEPTNHMDLPSIECLEDALSNCPAALLLVSHDLRFLKALTTSYWEILGSPDEQTHQLVIRSSWKD